MIYKAFAAATLALALLVGLMADRLTPVRAPESSAAPASALAVEAEAPSDIARPQSDIASFEEESAALQDMPTEMPAFGQPMPGADTPSLSPGNGLPEAPVSSIESVDEDMETESAG
ncbi:hypothetical protein SAMN02927924_02018 [Sphingobium faniae]|nr:hypothetical protein SAMN02927924_02018 [Sphingobium faniae]